jgi:hypothetical protein
VLVHGTEFLEVDRRYNYTTPKTFLELIKLYKNVLLRKRKQTQVRGWDVCSDAVRPMHEGQGIGAWSLETTRLRATCCVGLSPSPVVMWSCPPSSTCNSCVCLWHVTDSSGQH